MQDGLSCNEFEIISTSLHFLHLSRALFPLSPSSLEPFTFVQLINTYYSTQCVINFNPDSFTKPYRHGARRQKVQLYRCW